MIDALSVDHHLSSPLSSQTQKFWMTHKRAKIVRACLSENFPPSACANRAGWTTWAIQCATPGALPGLLSRIKAIHTYFFQLSFFFFFRECVRIVVSIPRLLLLLLPPQFPAVAAAAAAVVWTNEFQRESEQRLVHCFRVSRAEYKKRAWNYVRSPGLVSGKVHSRKSGDNVQS